MEEQTQALDYTELQTVVYNGVVDAVNQVSPVPVHDDLLVSIQNQLDGLSSAVQSLGEDAATDETAEEVVYTVRLDPSQVETAKGAARLLCTEGLLVVILLAVVVGLRVFEILSGRWGNNG